MSAAPLTLGTAGHIDHGKTALVRSLTGVETDRLPEERHRGISIDLGYAPLTLPNGRRISVVDVPGHERFVRTMVAGATGIDLFLLVVAADDGVMPQTIEHAAVLRALDVTHGVVAITKSDVAEPEGALTDARALLAPWAKVEVAVCSAHTGAGVADVARALERAAADLPGRTGATKDTILHVDRSFTIRGAGTVVTGTLWSGEVARGDRLRVLPHDVPARARGIHVHDAAVPRATAGQRVALNLAGIDVGDVARGDVIASAGALRPSHILDADLTLDAAARPFRATIHHGTRETPGRLIDLGSGRWQLRVERPLLARDGDRIVVRGISPPQTLGGGVITDAHARRHGPRAPDRPPVPTADAELAAQTPTVSPPLIGPNAQLVEQRLRDAGHEPPNDADLGADAAELAGLRAAGRIVRIGRSMHAHVDVTAAVRERVLAIIEAEDHITVARLRDDLKTTRKYALALLEHLDATRATLRLPDDSRVARRSSRHHAD